MGKKPRARLRFGRQIKQYMHILEHSSKPLVIKAPLELEVKKPSPGAKPRNPAVYPWLHKGEAKGRIFKDIDPVPFNRIVDVPFGVCFNCWQYTHQQSNCPKATLDDHCQNCGRIGVKISTCPRCRRVYRVYRQKNKIKQTSDADAVSPPAKEIEKNQNEVQKFQEFELPPARLSILEGYFSYNDYFPSDEEFSYNEDLSNIIIDEGIPAIITADFLESFLNFTNAVQFLPPQKKTDLAQKYLVECRRQLMQENIER